MGELADQSCKHVEGEPLSEAASGRLLAKVDGWHRDGQEIMRSFQFKDHYEAMAFVHAVAYISHAENHHPEMTVGYNTVTVRYSTHSVGGLSENDFICAAKVDRLL